MNRSTIIRIIIVVLVLVVGGYFIITSGGSSSPDKSATHTLPTDNSSTSISKLKVEDLKIGSGSAIVKSGDTVVINYVGTLTDGTKFDSSYDRGQPFETQIGVGQVIKGWDLGVVGMKVGGKRRLTIPPDLGYGSVGQGPIPPNSTLIFEVELVGIK